MLGALFFGYLTDRLGRKRLFTLTLAVYLGAPFLFGILIETGARMNLFTGI